MGIRDELQKVMELQPQYSSLPTAAMQARGQIIKHQLPKLLSENAEQLRLASDIEPGDFLLVGRDGIGRKSQVPWVRFASEARSPTATEGWYVVWLFREDGSGVYLAVSHASTEKIDGDFIKRSPGETQRLTRWALEILENDITADPRLLKSMTLGGGSLAKAYESTTAVSYFYAKDRVPSDDQLRADMLTMARLLKSIYRGEPAQKRSGQTSPDVIAVVEAIEETASGRKKSGQGFGLTQPQRRAVELQAMALAKEHFGSAGYEIKDTSATAPYDLEIRKEGQVHYIEVKGTTGGLGDIVLTKNEVQHHLKHHPNNGLFVVHGIQLQSRDGIPVCAGGTAHIQQPWQISDANLQALAYRYRIA